MNYGIKLKEGFWSRLIRNLPLVNLLYTKKVRIEAIRIMSTGVPVSGVWMNVRLPRWWMKYITLSIALDEDSQYTFIVGSCDEQRIFELALKDPCFIAYDWRDVHVIRADV